MRRFNVTGTCIPSKHYMVDISGKIAQIRKLVDYGSYFTINRARQYGKTTTLKELKKALDSDYFVAFLSFEGIGDESFASPSAFCQMFLGLVRNALRYTNADNEYIKSWQDSNISDFSQLNEHITERCSDRKIVLMIDEVDKTSDNRTFIHFLGMLRSKFLASQSEMDFTFHSVILAGVYDIRNIKLKMINEGTYTPTASEGKLYNSPWNIAVSFNVDMSFNPSEIATMLNEYEADHNTGMDITVISEEIYSYTSGYPYLASRICQCIDEELDKDWTAGGVRKAVDIILKESSTLFDDLSKNLESNEKLYTLIYNLLICGAEITLNTDNPTINTAVMYGIVKNSGRRMMVANRIFEIRICNYFISKDEEERGRKYNGILGRDVIKDGRFDMEMCLKKFAEHYTEIFCDTDGQFLERHGRLVFLSYLRPLINGYGFYHIESQFTDLRRMDIVVDFGSDQFIIELKLWKGDAKHHDAYEQLHGYLESKNADTGYLLTFDFRRSEHRADGIATPRAQWVEHGGKRIFDVVV